MNYEPAHRQRDRLQEWRLCYEWGETPDLVHFFDPIAWATFAVELEGAGMFTRAASCQRIAAELDRAAADKGRREAHEWHNLDQKIAGAIEFLESAVGPPPPNPAEAERDELPEGWSGSHDGVLVAMDGDARGDNWQGVKQIRDVLIVDEGHLRRLLGDLKEWGMVERRHGEARLLPLGIRMARRRH